MRTKFIPIVTGVFALCTHIYLPAQVLQAPTESQPVDAASGLAALITGLKLREDAVAKVTAGSEKPDAVVARLKIHASPFGLKLDPDADFSFAAIDVGQRLVAKGKYTEAEIFFAEAEIALVRVIAKTPDKSAKDKAMLLQHLSLVRSEYLNKRVQAKEDIEAAIKLQPDEKYFQGFRDQLANDQGQPATLAAGASKN